MKQQNAYKKLGRVDTVCDIPREQLLENIKFWTYHPWRFGFLQNLTVMSVEKGDMPIALVGGGPSVRNYVNELKKFPGVVVSCGSAHAWCMKNGITPNFAVVCDADPVMTKYFGMRDGRTLYLVATQCDKNMFNMLKNNAVTLWHCYNNNEEDLKSVDPNYIAIGGGCTVGLRALSIAVLMKFKNIHFYGFDSCLGHDRSHHAYGFMTNTETTGEVYNYKLEATGKEYDVLGYHIAQVENFKDFYSQNADKFTPTFHGEGLLPDVVNNIHKEVESELSK